MADKKKELTPSQEAFLEALFDEAGGNIRKAMTIAGYSTGTKLSDVVNPLREEIIAQTNLALAMHGPKAAYGLINVLNDPSAMGARNAVGAAKEILDRIGVIKKEGDSIKVPSGGIFILPAKQASKDEDSDES